MWDKEQINTGDNYPAVDRGVPAFRAWVIALMVVGYFAVCAGIIFYFEDTSSAPETEPVIIVKQHTKAVLVLLL